MGGLAGERGLADARRSRDDDQGGRTGGQRGGSGRGRGARGRRGGRQLLGAQDGEFQSAQSRSGVDAEFVPQPVAHRAVLGERLGLPPRAVERLDELLGETFAHRVPACALVQVDQDLMAVSGGEFEVADPFQHAQPLLFECGHRIVLEHARGDVGEGLPLPEGERLAQPVELLPRAGHGPGAGRERTELDEVEGLVVAVHPVTARYGLDGGRRYAVLGEQPAQPQDARLQCGAGRCGRFLVPYGAQQVGGRHHRVRVQQKCGEQTGRLGRFENDGFGAVRNAQGPQKLEPDD